MSDQPTSNEPAWEGWFSARSIDDDADHLPGPTGEQAPFSFTSVDAEARVEGAPATGAPATGAPSIAPDVDAFGIPMGGPATSHTQGRRPWKSILTRRRRGDGAAGPRRWPKPDRMTYVLAGLLVVVAAGTTVRYVTRPQPEAAVRSACTQAITSTGAVAHTGTLRSAEGTAGRWTVGVQATDGSKTQQWICHVTWDGAHATILTAVPDQ
jgi:hypothetical protein